MTDNPYDRWNREINAAERASEPIGWNDPESDPLVDVRRAADEIPYPTSPTDCLTMLGCVLTALEGFMVEVDFPEGVVYLMVRSPSRAVQA